MPEIYRETHNLDRESRNETGESDANREDNRIIRATERFFLFSVGIFIDKLGCERRKILPRGDEDAGKILV